MTSHYTFALTYGVFWLTFAWGAFFLDRWLRKRRKRKAGGT